MSPVSRGFRRKREAAPADRVPPGQYVTKDFPVLSAGPTPHTPLSKWTFSIDGGREPVSWTWEEFRALPTETLTTDIHCVTRWSKLDTMWEGVSLDVLLGMVDYDARYVLAFSDGGYTTNLPVADLLGGKAWVAFGYGGGPADRTGKSLVTYCPGGTRSAGAASRLRRKPRETGLMAAGY